MSTQVTAAFITPECRANRGDEGAWDEAVARLRAEYDAVLQGWRNQPSQPTLNLVLTMDRPAAVSRYEARTMSEMERAYEDFYGESFARPTKDEDLKVSREAWAAAFLAGLYEAWLLSMEESSALRQSAKAALDCWYEFDGIEIGSFLMAEISCHYALRNCTSIRQF